MKKNKTLQEDFLEALESYKRRDFKKSELICYKILNIDAFHFDSISLLATISAVNRNFENAKVLILKALEIQPKNKTALNNLGTTYKELGDLKEAQKVYEKILKIDSKHVNANYNLGVVYYVLKDFKNAKKYLQKTVDIQKNYGLAFFNLANVHVELREFKEALSCYQKALEINPRIVGAHNNLGLLYRNLNDFENAIDCYQKAIKIQPNHVAAYHNMAQSYKEIGDFKKSIEAHEKAIKLEPDNLMNDHFLSELKKDILDFNLKEKIHKILNKENPKITNLAYGNYLLAKYEKKEKNYDKELNYLNIGHSYFGKSNKKKFDLGIKYCFDDVLQIEKNAEIKKTKNEDKLKIKPIFIFGVPRSGSTLIERIIVSGKKYIPIGEETGVIGNFIPAKVLEKQSLNLGKASELQKELIEIYREKGLISKKYNYIFTDKSLDNFFYLRLIKEIFPEAKFVQCKRDCFSSIMSIFQNNLSTLAWAHDLDNIFKYFNNYFEIVENYKKINPDTIYDIQFEEFISDPEKGSIDLMKYCDLPWDKKCLEFYKRKDLVSKTASSIQVREAIYKHPAERYLPYRKFLGKYEKIYPWFKIN